MKRTSWIAGGMCVLSAWTAVIALTWEHKVVAAICGIVFVSGVVLFIVQAARVRRELEAARAAADARMMESAERSKDIKGGSA